MNSLKINQIVNGWEYIGQRNRKPRFRYVKADNWHFTGDRDQPSDDSQQPLTYEAVINLSPGCVCPRCRGTGTYKWHSPDRRKVQTSVCYWCNDPREGNRVTGKGYLDARDLYYILNALAEGRISYLRSA